MPGTRAPLLLLTALQSPPEQDFQPKGCPKCKWTSRSDSAPRSWPCGPSGARVLFWHWQNKLSWSTWLVSPFSVPTWAIDLEQEEASPSRAGLSAQNGEEMASTWHNVVLLGLAEAACSRNSLLSLLSSDQH